MDWYFVDRTLITNRKYYPTPSSNISNDCLAQVVTSSPIALWPDIMQGYVRILLEAKKYVYIESPYFLPTDQILFAMRTAALTGVDVRLIIPKKTDSKIVQWASRSYISEILEAGIRVYLYTPGFNHTKLLVCDDIISTCGSTNVDFRSFENNFESNIFFYQQEMALRMKEVFLNDMEQCEEKNIAFNYGHNATVKGYRKINLFFIRLWESLTRLLSPLL